MAIRTTPQLPSTSLNTDLREEIRQRNEEAKDNKDANEALNAAGIDIDTKNQAVDVAGLAKGYREWKDYMSNYFENNTKRLIDNTVPTFAVKDGKVKIIGTRAALDSPLAASAKKALSSLVGADITSEAFQGAINELNKSMETTIKDYIVTEAYGFKDTDDYNNYLLALQESRRPNPMNSTYYFIAKDKNGNYVKKTYKEWIDYWRQNYSTDERVDLFNKSAESQYGYDRIPYILMAGGSERGNARYGFDTGEYLSLGLYNTGIQTTKLPHGIVQQATAELEGINPAKEILKQELGLDDDSAMSLVLKVPDLTEEQFNAIKYKLEGHGPVKGGIDTLSNQEKAVLAMGVTPGMRGNYGSFEDFLKSSNYDSYKNKAQAAHGIVDRNEKMEAINERIQKNMAVYGGNTLNFASTMLGVMARQFEEAAMVKAMTGGVVDLNQLGEKMGDAVASAFFSGGSDIGKAAAKSVAQFVGGIPEDMIQDFIDSKMTNDPTLADDILTSENIVSNIMYRLTFNAIKAGTYNLLKNYKNIKQLSRAAKAAGYDIDADDVKRGVSEALDALNSGKKLYTDKNGNVMYEDADGNIKTLDNVTVWSLQPLADDTSNILSDAVKDKVKELTADFETEQKVRVSDVPAIRDYFSTGEWDYTVGKIGGDTEVDVPTKIKKSIISTAMTGGKNYSEHFSNLKNNLSKYGFDYDTVYANVDHTRLAQQIKRFNDGFGVNITTEGKSLPELLKEIVTVVMKAGRDSFTEESVDRAVSELLNDDRFGHFVASGLFKHTAAPRDVIFGYPNPRSRIADAIDTIGKDFAQDAGNKIESLTKLVRGDEAKGVLADITIAQNIYDNISKIMAAYAPAFDVALNRMTIDDVVNYTSDVVVGVVDMLNSDEMTGTAKAAAKVALNDYLNELDNIRYQMEYNQHFTPVEEHVLGDIHGANEMGVAFNAQKAALMDMALTKTPAQFVFGATEGEDFILDGLYANFENRTGENLKTFPFDLTNDDGAGLLNLLNGRNKKYNSDAGNKVDVVLMTPTSYLDLMIRGDSIKDIEHLKELTEDPESSIYAEQMENGAKFPILTATYDENGKLVKQEGRHRAIALSESSLLSRVPVAIQHPKSVDLDIDILDSLYGYQNITDDVAKIIDAKNSLTKPEDGGLGTPKYERGPEFNKAKIADWKKNGQKAAQEAVKKMYSGDSNSEANGNRADGVLNRYKLHINEKDISGLASALYRAEWLLEHATNLTETKITRLKLAVADISKFLNDNGYEVHRINLGDKYNENVSSYNPLKINGSDDTPYQHQYISYIDRYPIYKDGAPVVRANVIVDTVDTAPESAEAPADGGVVDARSAFTQNELLEIWTEAQYKDMTVEKMLKIMEDEFTDDENSIDDPSWPKTPTANWATDYIKNGGADGDRRPINYWFDMSSRTQEWIDEQGRAKNPAAYKQEDGSYKISGRSALELKVLQDKKLWAASLINLKYDLGALAHNCANDVGAKVANGMGLTTGDGLSLGKAYSRLFTYGVSDEARNEFAASALGFRSKGVPPEVSEEMNVFTEATGKKVSEEPAAFLEWIANKYAMGHELYQLKEYSAAATMPMAKFLETPITVGRNEKIWGPGRLVTIGTGGPEEPSMNLANETCLGFSYDLTGVRLQSSASDPGSVTLKVRPIDMIGDLGSIFASEREVFIRKSLVYPAGNKIHTILFDGTITTDANMVIRDKNARMYQIDESLVINNHDYRKAKDAFAQINSEKRDGGDGWKTEVKNFLNGDNGLSDFQKAMNEVVETEDIVRTSPLVEALENSVYGRQIAEAALSDNPFTKYTVNSIFAKLSSNPHTADITNEMSMLLNKPFVVKDNDYGFVAYTKGIVPSLDDDIATNGGVHLNDPQAKRIANVQKVLTDWKAAANGEGAEVKSNAFIENSGLNVDGNMVSFTSLLDNGDATAKMTNSRQLAQNASTEITMSNRLDSTPADAPEPIKWAEPQTYKFDSYADALANRPSYRNAQNYDTWLPAAVEAGMKEFTDWRDNVFLVAHPDLDMAQMVESWDFVNFLVHKGDSTVDPDIDAIIGKTFVDSSGREVTITKDVLDLYGEYDSFIKNQGARIAALKAQGFDRDYNQLGYLPHTDYDPMNQSAEEMLQGVLWKENTLANSTTEDGTFTTDKLDNNFENRYRIWISNMSFDSLGDVAAFGEKMKELIADGVFTPNTDALRTKDGTKVKPQEAVAKAIEGDKDLNKQAAKTKSAKDFNKLHTKIDNKVDLKQLDADVASDVEKIGYSKALHDRYGDLYGNSRAKVVSQKNEFVSKITGLYDFMRSTTTTDGSLLNHGGEMLINPVGMANNIVRLYRQNGDLKGLVTDLLVRKSGRTRKGAEYLYNKWLPDIKKRINADGTINSTELASVLTKHLRYEAWTSIKKWLARADYDSFNNNVKKTLDNLLYRHNMIQQISNTPSVMKTINKAVNAIVGQRHRALFYLNPKNAILQLSECIRLFTNFSLGDATKTLKRLVSDAAFRDTVAEWRSIIFPERNTLKDIAPMADAWAKTAAEAKLGADGTLTLKGRIKGGIEEADAIMLAPIDAAEDMKNTVIIAGIVQELETKKANGTLKETDYDFVMRRFQRVALANDEFGRLGYSDNPFARATLYLQNFTIRQLKMFGDNVIDSWGEGGAAKAFGYLAKALGWRTALFLVMAKLGYSAGQVLGYDPFDMIGDDYTGLDEEDMTELDKQIKSGWLSPLFVGGLTSLVQNYYFAARQAYERTNEATPADEAETIAQDTEDWGLKMPDVDWFELLYGWAPAGGAARRTVQMAELLDKGVAVSQSGTKMYEAPSDLGNAAAGFLFGRTNTANARDYFQTPDPLQGLIDNGLGGLAQQMGRAFSTGFREFDPIDKTNYTDWFDGSEADEQQWQSGYYYFRNKARKIFDAYNGQSSSYNSTLDQADLKSSYREEMEKLGEELNRFTQAYVSKHGQLEGPKMQQLLNILNDAQVNLMMEPDVYQQESLAGLNRAQERYSNAGLPAVTRQTGPSVSSPDTEYGKRFSPQFYNAVQGYYGAPREAAKIVEDLYNNKWKNLRKQYSEAAYKKDISFKDRENIQREYINLVKEDLDGIVSLYGSGIFTNDAVDDVMTDVFAGMIPYGDYNVNKKGRRVSLPSNVEVDVSDWLQEQYSKSAKQPQVSYSAEAKGLFDKMNSYLDNGNKAMAKSTARLILERVQSNRLSLTRSELEEVQRILND